MSAVGSASVHTYLLGGQRFRSKKAIKEHIRAFIDATPIGSTILDPVLLDLLPRHPQWEEKSQGMTRLMVGMAFVEHANVMQKSVLIEQGVNHCDITWSRLVDRLQLDGSLRQVDARGENLRKIKVAARSAIQDQILLVDKLPGEHVDHIYPRTFDRLLFLFLKWWGQPVSSIKVDDPCGIVIQPRFACWELHDNWSLFHQRVARLRAVPVAVNMAARIYPINWNLLP